MNKVYLIQTQYFNYDDESLEIRVAVNFKKAKEIFDDLVKEELSTTYSDCEDYDEFDISETNFDAWDFDNRTHIWIEEKEIEQ